MFTYTATISEKSAPAWLIPSQLTSRPGWNFTYNNDSDRGTNELKVSQLTSCNHLLPFFNIVYEKVNCQHIKIELINSKTENRQVLTLQELKTDSQQI